MTTKQKISLTRVVIFTIILFLIMMFCCINVFDSGEFF